MDLTGCVPEHKWIPLLDDIWQCEECNIYLKDATCWLSRDINDSVEVDYCLQLNCDPLLENCDCKILEGLSCEEAKMLRLLK